LQTKNFHHKGGRDPSPAKPEILTVAEPEPKAGDEDRKIKVKEQEETELFSVL
jgi:hypothetical protein